MGGLGLRLRLLPVGFPTLELGLEPLDDDPCGVCRLLIDDLEALRLPE